MTVASIFSDMLLIFVFLIVGFIIRELIRPLQKIFMPASVIGGFLLLLLGQQVIGLVEVPKSFSSFSGVLIDLIMCALVFGIKLNKEKIKSYLDYSCIGFGLYGAQIAVGAVLGLVLSKIWGSLPQGWGLMGVFSFYGGHGTAAAAGAAFEQLGIENNTALGMIFSTIGMIAAIIFGMAFVNYGVRRGYASFVKEASKQDKSFYMGVVEEGKRKSIGAERVSSISINGLAFQFALLGTALFIGRMIFKGLALLNPFFGSLPSMLHGIVGGCLTWFIMTKLHLDQYADKKTINSISGFCLEIVILTAISTIKLSLVSTFLVPITIYSLVLIVFTFILVTFFCKKCCKDQWFEKALMMYGMGTGSTPTGLALVRSVDPESESCAGDAHGVFATLNVFSKVAPAILPPLILTSVWSVFGIGAGMSVLALAIVWILFRKGVKTKA